VIDLAAEVLAALRSPEGRAALVDPLRPVIAEAVRAVLDERERDALLGIADLAALLGCSPAAAKARVHRDSELAGLALRVGSRRKWRRSEVLTLLESRRSR